MPVFKIKKKKRKRKKTHTIKFDPHTSEIRVKNAIVAINL